MTIPLDLKVLIVAKCIVNVDVNDVTNGNNIVLIVAKCIVNAKIYVLAFI